MSITELYNTGILYAFLVLLALCVHDSYKMWPGIEEFLLGLLVCVVLALAWPIVIVLAVFFVIVEVFTYIIT